MKKYVNIAIIFTVALSMITSLTLESDTAQTTDEMDLNDQVIIPSSKRPVDSDHSIQQEIQDVKKLMWDAPPNAKLPVTVAEYYADRPRPVRFSTPPVRPQFFPPIPVIKVPASELVDGNPIPFDYYLYSTLSVLVDATLYPGIAGALDQFRDDLRGERVYAQIQTVSGGTPEEIKAWVIEQYNQGSIGILFVGDITAAFAEVSEAVFPCDLFYMDVDGNWEDQDYDMDYEIHTAGTGDQGPEIYVARINAHTLNYDTEANMVNDYFAKAHMYHSGGLTQPWRGLEYVDEDWYDMEVDLDLIYGGGVIRYDYGYFTTAEDYLNQMDLGQHFVQVCAHSYPGGHHFSTRPTESAAYAYVYVYSPSNRSAKIRLGSDDGIKVWLNGDLVCTHDVSQGWLADQYTHNVDLNNGWNRLLCKISQGGGDYMFSARFTDTSYQTFDDLEYQINNPDSHGEEGEFIRSWLLNGFHQDISDNFWNYLTTNYLGVAEGSINPNEGEIMGGETWNTYNVGCPYIDMADYCEDADFGVCYAFIRVYADAAKSCQLWMGYDDGARIWLNGQQVLYDNRYGDYEVDMTKVNVNLNAGENRLLVKVSEWMGEHGFSARFCYSDGTPVDGLSYDPTPTPISYIGTWLMNGPYVNPDQATRLSTDYLGDEAAVIPSEGDPAPFGTWERGIGNGYPFNVGTYYDHGDWVYSDTIQSRDPPVLFYNLFSCGPGDFTYDNYLAGAYIFHTTHGLITVASSKSGSMLNFDDFTRPIGEGKSIGASFLEWFDAQAPFELWEKEWYYGMVVCGDPTLKVVN